MKTGLILILFISSAFGQQPVLTRMVYGPPTPMVQGVSYDQICPQLYFEDDGLPKEGLNSGTFSWGVTATITLTWTNIDVTKSYAVCSTPNLFMTNVFTAPWPPPGCTNCTVPPSAQWDGWVVNSYWMQPAPGQTSMSFTQGCIPGQRFFRIAQRP